MAKGGKLGKLLKKMQSIARTSSHQSIVTPSNSNFTDNSLEYISSNNLLQVYVGKTRRRYMVDSNVVSHPLFRELVERSTTTNKGGIEEICVGCEVVLFEHLLWMLQNADPYQPESLNELADFYAS